MYRSKTLIPLFGLLLVISIILYVDFSRIDDIPYHETVGEDVLTIDMFSDSDAEYDQVLSEKLVVEHGEGTKGFSAPVSFQEGDSLLFSFEANNPSGKNVTLTVGLYDTDTGKTVTEKDIVLNKPEGTYDGELQYYENRVPENGEFKIWTDKDTEIEIFNLRADVVSEVKDGNKIVNIAMRIMLWVAVFAAVALMTVLVMSAYTALSNRNRIRQFHKRNYGSLIAALILVSLIIAILAVLYRHVDIRYPIIYQDGDEMGIYYLVKTISREGTTLVNRHVGGLYGGDMFDYPYSDKLSFLFVKLLSLFTTNVYLNTNLFYFLNFVLNGLAAFYVSRKLELQGGTAVLTGLLFAFCPFIQLRFAHMWLTSLYMIPFGCMIAVNIVRGRYLDNSGKPVFNLLLSSAMVAFLCAFTGLYYAYFVCAMIAAAFVIRLVNHQGKGIRGIFYPVIFVCSTILGVIVNVLPNFIYWMIHGVNSGGQISMRSGSESEFYGLKLIQLVLPRPGHRIGQLSALTARYSSTYPLVNENWTASIGVIASIGLIITILLLFDIKEKKMRGREIACLNISAFLIATIGGLGSIISLVVNIPMRCYNRMSVVMMFLSLLCVGICLEQFGEKHPVLYKIGLPLLMVIGIFDQTITVLPSGREAYISARNLLKHIDQQMNDGDMIFELPFDTWPSPTTAGTYKQFIGYIETNGLNWSYGSMESREESDWQMDIADRPTGEFVDILLYNGYDGIYLDSSLYDAKYGENAAAEKVTELTSVTGTDPIVSEDNSLYFWDIRNVG